MARTVTMADLFCGAGGTSTGAILAAAMGFLDYDFSGNKTEQVRQIGNAVPVNTAKALVKTILAA